MKHRLRNILIIGSLLGLSGCLHYVTHQGNVLDPAKIAQIREGDTKFHVETLLGTPVLKNTLHPNRVTYIEDYKNPETGETYRRGIEITYDAALRVTHIRRFGFDRE
ncbi:MAG: outer membrane protein assembly factor BamE [Mariprofundaceae bacterium]